MSAAADVAAGRGLPKAPTGIGGLDEITRGGLPQGRSTLVTGGTGSGKTLLGLQFLVAGAREYGEPGVLVTFEESAEKVSANVASLGFDLDGLQRDGLLVVHAFRLDPSEVVETGEFDFEPLFLLLGDTIERIGAKRVVLDTIELLFGAFRDQAIVRAELGRLFRWLEDHAVTAIMTGERGDTGLTRQGIEEYVSDCVIVLDHRIRRRDFHPPPQGGQVPRVGARDQRVPVPDFGSRLCGAADHLGGPGLRRARGTDLDRGGPPGSHAGGRPVPGIDRAGQRGRGHG